TAGAAAPVRPSATTRLGAAISRRLPSGRRPVDDVTARWRGRTALAAVAAAPIAPPLAVLVVVGGWVRERSARAGRQRRHLRDVAQQLPDDVDLLLLCTGAGLSLPLAHERLCGRLPGPVGDAFESSA